MSDTALKIELEKNRLRHLQFVKQLHENMKSHSPKEYENTPLVEISREEYEYLIEYSIEHLSNKLRKDNNIKEKE